MEQRSEDAPAEDVQIKHRKEDCVEGMESLDEKTEQNKEEWQDQGIRRIDVQFALCIRALELLVWVWDFCL
jgi:hypothetical protein